MEGLMMWLKLSDYYVISKKDHKEMKQENRDLRLKVIELTNLKHNQNSTIYELKTEIKASLNGRTDDD